jgi:hypothetical protein
LALIIVSVETYAQDLEPRAFANTPVGLNFLIGGYVFSKGTVGTDPSVPITDTEIELHSTVLAYVRTLDLWGRSGKFDVIVPYTWADGSAKVVGQPRTRKVSGLNDPRLRFSMLLYGAPALSLEEFRDYEPDVIIGTSLEVTAPLGQYDSDKLLNIGTNRWSFKPEVGISKTLGPLTLGYGWGSMVSTIPGGAGSSTEKKANVSKTPAWALPWHYRLTGTTRSNSTAAAAFTRRPAAVSTWLEWLGSSAGAADCSY